MYYKTELHLQRNKKQQFGRSICLWKIMLYHLNKFTLPFCNYLTNLNMFTRHKIYEENIQIHLFFTKKHKHVNLPRFTTLK